MFLANSKFEFCPVFTKQGRQQPDAKFGQLCSGLLGENVPPLKKCLMHVHFLDLTELDISGKTSKAIVASSLCCHRIITVMGKERKGCSFVKPFWMAANGWCSLQQKRTSGTGACPQSTGRFVEIKVVRHRKAGQNNMLCREDVSSKKRALFLSNLFDIFFCKEQELRSRQEQPEKKKFLFVKKHLQQKSSQSAAATAAKAPLGQSGHPIYDRFLSREASTQTRNIF